MLKKIDYQKKTQAEYLKISDVTLEDRRKMKMLSVLNLISYVVQILVIVITCTLSVYEIIPISIFLFKDVPTPLNMNQNFVVLGWAVVLIFELIFVAAALPCFHPGEHYKNVLLLKVKYAFVFQCLIQAGAILSYAINQFRTYFLSFSCFLVLKSKY